MSKAADKHICAPYMPLVLRVWCLGTRIFAVPIQLVSRHLHNRMGADPDRFAERLGRPSRGAEDGAVIWIHAASLGEVAQIRPLVEGLSQTGQSLLVTTTTQAGADWVARELPGVIHQFAPMDTPSAVAGFLGAWQVSAVIFIEGDFGPRLTLEVQARGTPQILLNARHSRTRARFPHVFATLLSGFTLVTCRSEPVADSIRALGVPEDRVMILPDLRIASGKLPCPVDVLQTLKAQIGTRQVWFAASTHPPDEEAVLAAHKTVLAAHPDALLILAPRHPKRGNPFETTARARGFITARRSKGDALTSDTQVYLADTLGELGVFFSLAPITFLGGSIGDEGGHNPYEPATFGSAILSGSKVKNFAEAYAALTEIGAAALLEDPTNLGLLLVDLIGSNKAETMGAAGRRFMEASESSVSETVALISRVLDG